MKHTPIRTLSGLLDRFSSGRSDLVQHLLWQTPHTLHYPVLDRRLNSLRATPGSVSRALASFGDFAVENAPVVDKLQGGKFVENTQLKFAALDSLAREIERQRLRAAIYRFNKCFPTRKKLDAFLREESAATKIPCLTPLKS